MASSNDKAIIPAPVMGLRQDIDRSVSTSDQIVSGVNVISLDQTIRPRPCNRLLGAEYTAPISWLAVLDGANAFGVFDDSNIIAQVLASEQISVSVDGGENWADIGDCGSINDKRIAAFVWADPYIYAIEYEGFKVHRGDAAGWSSPDPIVFSEWCDHEDTNPEFANCSGFMNDPSKVLYDSENDSIYFYWEGYWFGGSTDPLTKFFFRIEDASKASSPGSLDKVFLDPPTTDVSFYKWDLIAIIDEDLWVAWHVLKPPFGDGGDSYIASYDLGSVSSIPYPVDVYLRDDQIGCRAEGGASNFDGDSLMILHSGGIRRLELDTGIVSNALVSSSSGLKFYVSTSNFDLAIGLDVWYTEDDWDTSHEVESPPSTSVLSAFSISGGELSGGWFFHAAIPSSGVGVLYTLKGEVEDEGLATSIFQIDLDIQQHAVFLGTTKNILFLNRTTDEWDDAGPAAGFTGTRESAPVIFRAFDQGGETWILATNGKDQPVMWNEDMVDPKLFIDIVEDGGTDKPPVASAMAISANRVLFGGLPANPYGVTASALNDHRTGWKGSATGTKWVTYGILADTPGKIVGMMEITGLSVAVYKEDAIYHAIAQAEFLGTEAPFRFELAKSGIAGPCSALSVVRMMDGRQAYLSLDGGVYLYDGVNPQDCGRHIRTAIQQDIDEYHMGLSWGMIDPYRQLLWFHYPTSGGKTNRGLVLQIDQPPPWPAWRVAFPYGWDMATGGRIFNFSDKTIGSFTEKFGDVSAPLGSFASGRYDMTLIRANKSMYRQKWTDDGDYTDATIPIDFNWTQGWENLGDPWEFSTVHEAQHIIDSPDPSFLARFQIAAQQANVNDIEVDDIEYIGPSVPQMKTSHRITGTRMAAIMSGSIKRIFRWGGCCLYHSRRGPR